VLPENEWPESFFPLPEPAAELRGRRPRGRWRWIEMSGMLDLYRYSRLSQALSRLRWQYGRQSRTRMKWIARGDIGSES